MFIYVKTFKIIVLSSILFAIPIHALAIADPTDFIIKSWLEGKKILVKKRKFLNDKYENIDPSKIQTLIRASKNSNLGPIKTSVLLDVNFDYIADSNIKLPCVSSISYNWTTISFPPDKFDLENITVKCTPPS